MQQARSSNNDTELVASHRSEAQTWDFSSQTSDDQNASASRISPRELQCVQLNCKSPHLTWHRNTDVSLSIPVHFSSMDSYVGHKEEQESNIILGHQANQELVTDLDLCNGDESVREIIPEESFTPNIQCSYLLPNSVQNYPGSFQGSSYTFRPQNPNFTLLNDARATSYPSTSSEKNAMEPKYENDPLSLQVSSTNFEPGFLEQFLNENPYNCDQKPYNCDQNPYNCDQKPSELNTNYVTEITSEILELNSSAEPLFSQSESSSSCLTETLFSNDFEGEYFIP